ncbi:MAG: hypothetical protein DMC59_02525, partial [Verrucomicrobia bacterium]
MANDESRISKGIANRAVAPAVLSGIRTPGECAEDTSPYSIRASSFFRHSTFGIRHLVNPMRILSGIQPSGPLHIGNYFG